MLEVVRRRCPLPVSATADRALISIGAASRGGCHGRPPASVLQRVVHQVGHRALEQQLDVDGGEGAGVMTLLSWRSASRPAGRARSAKRIAMSSSTTAEAHRHRLQLERRLVEQRQIAGASAPAARRCACCAARPRASRAIVGARRVGWPSGGRASPGRPRWPSAASASVVRQAADAFAAELDRAGACASHCERSRASMAWKPARSCARLVARRGRSGRRRLGVGDSDRAVEALARARRRHGIAQVFAQRPRHGGHRSQAAHAVITTIGQRTAPAAPCRPASWCGTSTRPDVEGPGGWLHRVEVAGGAGLGADHRAQQRARRRDHRVDDLACSGSSPITAGRARLAVAGGGHCFAAPARAAHPEAGLGLRAAPLAASTSPCRVEQAQLRAGLEQRQVAQGKPVKPSGSRTCGSSRSSARCRSAGSTNVVGALVGGLVLEALGTPSPTRQSTPSAVQTPMTKIVEGQPQANGQWQPPHRRAQRAPPRECSSLAWGGARTALAGAQETASCVGASAHLVAGAAHREDQLRPHRIGLELGAQPVDVRGHRVARSRRACSPTPHRAAGRARTRARGAARSAAAGRTPAR